MVSFHWCMTRSVHRSFCPHADIFATAQLLSFDDAIHVSLNTSISIHCYNRMTNPDFAAYRRISTLTWRLRSTDADSMVRRRERPIEKPIAPAAGFECGGNAERSSDWLRRVQRTCDSGVILSIARQWRVRVWFPTPETRNLPSHESKQLLQSPPSPTPSPSLYSILYTLYTFKSFHFSLCQSRSSPRYCFTVSNSVLTVTRRGRFDQSPPLNGRATTPHILFIRSGQCEEVMPVKARS